MNQVYVKTMGCKVNTYDSDEIRQQFKELGYQLVDHAKDADITVINTCSVTHRADREGRYLFRKTKRDKPDSKIVATGCYAQTDSATISEMDDVDFIVPNESKNTLAQMVDFALKTPEKSPFGSNKFPKDLKPVFKNKQGHFKSSLKVLPKISPSRTRAFLKIQDGCNGFCTYCLIPYARGASRSVSPESVYDEVSRLVDSGIQEIVFTGIHIGDYGEEFSDSKTPKPLIPLLRRILKGSGLQRLRISSLEPREATQELVDVMAEFPDQICDQFHLPLQSGSNEILSKMRRGYTAEEYFDSVSRLRSAFPNAMFGADVIPGFPGESEQHHQETIDLVEKCEINYLHVFPYSKRPGTAAIRMPDHVDGLTIKNRCDQLRKISSELTDTYYHRQIGKTADVLWEADIDDQGRRLGHTKNYLSVSASKKIVCEPGQISKVKLAGISGRHRLMAVLN